MVRVLVPSLSSSPLQLARPVQPHEAFGETKDSARERKLTDDGRPLSKYTVAVFGAYGVSSLVIKAPEVPGSDAWVPGTPLNFAGVSVLLYQPDSAKSLSGASVSADAVSLASDGDAKGSKTL